MKRFPSLIKSLFYETFPFIKKSLFHKTFPFIKKSVFHKTISFNNSLFHENLFFIYYCPVKSFALCFAFSHSRFRNSLLTPQSIKSHGSFSSNERSL